MLCTVVFLLAAAIAVAGPCRGTEGAVAAAAVGPSGSSSIVAAQGDDECGSKWGLLKVSAPQARVLCGDVTGTVVAVLDTGIYSSHPYLRDSIVAEANFSSSPIACDINGHGTHIAGIIAATAEGSRLMNVKVADESGCFQSKAAAAGIKWAVDHGADVINISLVDMELLPHLEEAVDYAWGRGVVVVAAAGNNVRGQRVYPACFANCIAVSAADSSDTLAEWANYDTWVDVAAPGVDIYSTMPFNEYSIKSGTSMAAAFVSGTAALLTAAAEDVNDNGCVNDEVRTAIEAGCDPLAGPGPEAGRINALRALKCLQDRLR